MSIGSLCCYLGCPTLYNWVYFLVPQLWPEGVFVWCFYEARKTVDINAHGAAKNDCVSDVVSAIALKIQLLSSWKLCHITHVAYALDRGPGTKRNDLFVSTDILCVQETMLPKQDPHKLNSVHDDLGIVCGRIHRGVAILWRKKYDSLVSVIWLEVDWAIAIKVAHQKSNFIVLNVYTPYENPYQNENEYLNRLGFISCFIKECECTCIFVLGDLNADVSPWY